jgi:hypothetical protein
LRDTAGAQGHRGVVAGLVPATPEVKAPSENHRGGRDKPGHDSGERPNAST